jgi:hypothetical protein
MPANTQAHKKLHKVAFVGLLKTERGDKPHIQILLRAEDSPDGLLAEINQIISSDEELNHALKVSRPMMVSENTHQLQLAHEPAPLMKDALLANAKRQLAEAKLLVLEVTDKGDASQLEAYTRKLFLNADARSSVALDGGVAATMQDIHEAIKRPHHVKFQLVRNLSNKLEFDEHKIIKYPHTQLVTGLLFNHTDAMTQSQKNIVGSLNVVIGESGLAHKFKFRALDKDKDEQYYGYEDQRLGFQKYILENAENVVGQPPKPIDVPALEELAQALKDNGLISPLSSNNIQRTIISPVMDGKSSFQRK